MTKSRTGASSWTPLWISFNQRSNQRRWRLTKSTAASCPNQTSPANGWFTAPCVHGPTMTLIGARFFADKPSYNSNAARVYESYQPPITNVGASVNVSQCADGLRLGCSQYSS